MSEGGATMIDPVLLYSEYDLIVDTNQASWGFYNELCAYCTGFTDSEENGKEYSDVFYLETGIEDDESPRGKVADEKNPFFDCLRFGEHEGFETPFSVMLNKRYGANEHREYAIVTEENCEEFSEVAPLSVAILFDLEPTQKQIQIIKERATKFFNEVWPKLNLTKDKVELEGFRLITRTHYGQETVL